MDSEKKKQEMTREEAIEFIKNIIGEESGRCIGKEGFYAELIGYHIEALKMAIQALSQEPKTQMVDKSNFDVNQYKLDIDTAYECGKASERQTGKWIYRRGDKYSCSKCGTTTSVDESGIEEKPMYKFCPYCGAKMESEDKE